jgi:hypothetical protein
LRERQDTEAFITTAFEPESSDMSAVTFSTANGYIVKGCICGRSIFSGLAGRGKFSAVSANLNPCQSMSLASSDYLLRGVAPAEKNSIAGEIK